jgi:hypothetical protein
MLDMIIPAHGINLGLDRMMALSSGIKEIFFGDYPVTGRMICIAVHLRD